MGNALTDEIDHYSEFLTLKRLVGNWSGNDEGGHLARVNYRLTANQSALVEDWTFYNDAEALTIYHMDRDTLMATHYCPIGNQPRLDLNARAADGTLLFQCVSATHLESFEHPHEHAFNLKIHENGTMYREETYVEEDGQLHSNGILFHRSA